MQSVGNSDKKKREFQVQQAKQLPYHEQWDPNDHTHFLNYVKVLLLEYSETKHKANLHRKHIHKNNLLDSLRLFAAIRVIKDKVK